MSFLTEWLTDWLKEILISGIIGNLSGLFENVNSQVTDIAHTVGMTPGAFNPGVFSLIESLSESIILPIAGLVLTFVMTSELISLVVSSNNLHHIDTWIFFKWISKTVVAVVILSNTFSIVKAIFEVAEHIIGGAAGVIVANTGVDTGMMEVLAAQLDSYAIGPLLGIWLQSFLINTIVYAVNIIIFIIVYSRMIEIYLMTSLAPIPMSTITVRSAANLGNNYMKSLFAIGFQGFLIMVCIAIYALLVQSIATSTDPMMAIWVSLGYTILLCFTLLKTGSVSKSIFSTH